MDLSDIRSQCKAWDEEDGCLDDYTEECPFHSKCEGEVLMATRKDGNS